MPEMVDEAGYVTQVMLAPALLAQAACTPSVGSSSSSMAKPVKRACACDSFVACMPSALSACSLSLWRAA